MPGPRRAWLGPWTPLAGIGDERPALAGRRPVGPKDQRAVFAPAPGESRAERQVTAALAPGDLPGPESERMSSDAKEPTGFASAAYAAAHGHPVLNLPASGGHLLLRPIADTGLRDASGCYPVFSCSQPQGLRDDLAQLPDDLVAVSMVPDPLLDFRPDALRDLFPIVRPLGDHLVVALDKPRRPPSRHHRRMLRQAAAHPIEMRVEPRPREFLDAWVSLHDILVAEVGIRGLRQFSRPIFAAMLEAPGTVVFTAWEHGDLLGADWYYQDQERVYAHLSAYAPEGYARSVSYPMMDAAIAHFHGKASVLTLGGVPRNTSPSDGLGYFKSGWSTGVRPAYFCGRPLDLAAYLRASGGREPSTREFFPHYRQSDYA